MPRLSIILAALPIAVYLIFSLLPASYKDPYAWVDPISLNTPTSGGRSRRWYNMGYWDGQSEFSAANEELGRKLMEFARPPRGGSVLDIAHGSGESLLLHLSASPPKLRIDALTSIPADTARARALVLSHKINQTIDTPVDFFTASAVPDLSRVEDQSHPLNPMKGFLGASKRDVRSPGGYNFIYILDAIYHFPPSLHSFLEQTLKSLAPGGVIAFTDLLPPPAGLNPLAAYLLSTFLDVPLLNLNSRPHGLEEYKAELEGWGYIEVEVQDWSASVWHGFAKDLKAREGIWPYVGSLVENAEKAGWRFVAVRAGRAAA